MHFVPFRSRSELHKTPFGAVAAGQATALRVILPRHIRCTGVRLCWGAYDGGWEMEAPLVWDGMEGTHEEWWRCAVTITEPGLYRYRFLFDTEAGRGVIGDEGGGVGCIGQSNYWQLTVFAPAAKLPDWVAGGIMYQIFPDRFRAAEDTALSVTPGDRLLRGDWGGEPQWQPNARGNITQYDFFGGNLRGIAEKLPYLAELGVTCLYLNPIFLAQSNHRYDTADYRTIDPLLGTEKDFRALCENAKQLGIHILLDGVFSHTGADSIYFNKQHRYPGAGAYESRDSQYYPWYHFRAWPQDYASWWGIDILPELQESHPAVLEFFAGKDGIARHWLRAGASGWRLDVADELPDVFLDCFFAAVQSEDAEGYVLGEVWEDASRKWSHGGRRRFLLGGQMHSVMNYPLAEAVLRFAREGDAGGLADTVMGQLEHYPPHALRGLMNHIGTHDTARALNRLGAGEPEPGADRSAYAHRPLRAEQRERGLRRLRLCAALQFTLPGNPCIYYGDEAGLEGWMDPFNRGCYPWGREDAALLDWYRALGALRRGCDDFAGLDFSLLSAMLGCIAYRRGRYIVIANANAHAIAYDLPERYRSARLALGGLGQNEARIQLAGESAALLTLGDEEE
ncbi:MAG: glycoside hydrolase family 13 protein [Oscillospiraceae bacterium]|jgi:glycosidase|nr:glycoside hydrolase family 13 protein [Oscillospiraceae bacterium]